MSVNKKTKAAAAASQPPLVTLCLKYTNTSGGLEAKEREQKDKVLNRLNNLGLKNYRQAFVIDSDAHSSAEISDKQIFWLKVEARKFSGIKQAFIDPEISISLSKPEVNRNYIKYIKFTNSDSFLGGLTIPFSDAMTAIIGARGTGKSSSIDYINLVFTYRYKQDDHGRDHQHLWHLLNQGNAFICLIFDGDIYIVYFEALNFKESHMFDSADDQENIKNFLSVLNESEKRSVTGIHVGRPHLTSQVIKKVIRKKITIYSVNGKRKGKGMSLEKKGKRIKSRFSKTREKEKYEFPRKRIS